MSLSAPTWPWGNGGGAENGKIPEFLAGFFAFCDEGKGMD